MPKDVILTPEGLEKLKAELEELTTTKRREVAERIKDAREYGDISENSEYDDAKNEQAMLEGKILDLEEKLRSASVIDAPSCRPTSSRSAPPSRSSPRRARARRTRSSARPSRTPSSASCPTSRRSAARSSARARARRSRSRCPTASRAR
jgi:hypothetical protein